MPIHDKRLQLDLQQIRQAVASMGEGVEIALKNAVQALLSGNEPLANMTVLMDYALDRQYREVEQLCHAFIARFLPSAGHLRLVSSAMRMVNDLERIADYAVNISRESLDLPNRPTGVLKQELETMASIVRTMLRQSLFAFADGNIPLAENTMRMNLQLGSQMEQAIRFLIEEGDSHTGHSREIMDLYVVFIMLERVGNRATNLCEEIIFWLSGSRPPPKPLHILFLDEENNALGLMAEAIARKSYDTHCHFYSAGRTPTREADPNAVAFMRTLGFDLAGMRPKSIATMDVQKMDLMIALQGEVRSYIVKPPFHTIFLSWDVGQFAARIDEVSTQRCLEEIYRELAVQLRQLMDLVSGSRESG
ncbi:MAG: phosphate signaling complex protein PhoU [Magnetococcales bacterium]|nr:phosphate signaling complex protein PhoU [Magnetococcales bacterium]NGZ05291.1 phosphate signaling complex protein PhoU [Magnetococcales bacterium]